MVRRKTTSEFVKAAIKVHGNRYDYSKVNYTGTDNKVIIICKEHGEFHQTAYEHSNGANCRRCRINIFRDCPDIATELDPNKNKNTTHRGKRIDILDMNIETSKKLDWKCKVCSHEWTATGHSRVGKGRGCPACSNKAIHIDGRNSMATTHPELANEYQGDATKIVATTHKILDWKCKTCSHEWSANGDNRARKGNGCPACASQVVHSDGRNNMKNTHPLLAEEFHTTKNGNVTPENLLAGTNKRIWWECSICDHIWSSKGSHRAEGSGCPACSSHEIHIDGINSMATTHPELSKEAQFDPRKVVAGTEIKLLWKCRLCKFEWQATGRKRAIEKRGCPSCAKTGFDPSMPSHYYCMSICGPEGIWWYKGGITANLQNRLMQIRNSLSNSNLALDIDILDSIFFEDGWVAQEFELKLLRVKSIREKTIEKFDGSSELFSVNPIEYARENGWLER